MGLFTLWATALDLWSLDIFDDALKTRKVDNHSCWNV